MYVYRFDLVVKGFGVDSDEAFADAVQRLLEDPKAAIEDDVTYKRRLIRVEELQMLGSNPVGEA